ncbi:MAG: sensor histidine kinase [Deinococcales bacterium]
MVGDGLLLAHVADNLLENAVRHGGGAPVRVVVETIEDGVALRVADDGPGVPAEALPHLGESFFRGDRARTGEGSGLGLAIVAHVVELHGGRWNVESAPGKGFLVSVVLPSATPA